MVRLTTATKPISSESIVRRWHLVDLKGQVLGRSAQKIASLLQGKHKVNFIRQLDIGDYVVAINAKDIVVTGKKAVNKVYLHYSGYPGGLKKETFANLIERRPLEVVRRAVLGMLPKNKLRAKMIKRLFIFTDNDHPYKERFNQLKGS